MVTFGPDLTLEQAIQQAVGAASMCWATPEGAGIFQEDRARAIADDLLAGLREGRWTGTPPSGRPETIKDPADHPDHPHGSTVEQVHRILGRAYADEPDRWMLAEELVKFVTKQVAQGTTAADDAFLAELVQAFARPLTPEDLSAPTDRLSIVESLIRAGRLKAGRPLLAGVYRHYKGPLYLVLDYAHDANAEDLFTHDVPGESAVPLGERTVVVYVGLQLDEAHHGARLAVRTASDFRALLHPDGTVCDDPMRETPMDYFCRCRAYAEFVRLTPRFAYVGPTWEGQR